MMCNIDGIDVRSYNELAVAFGFQPTPYGFDQMFQHATNDENLCNYLLNSGFTLFSDRWRYHLRKNHQAKGNRLCTILYELYGKQCHMCHNTTHNGHPIPLDTHHIDGDRSNNTLSNIILLCKNCHAQTENYKSKNHKDVVNIIDSDILLENYHKIHDVEYILHHVFHITSASAVRQAYSILAEKGEKK